MGLVLFYNAAYLEHYGNGGQLWLYVLLEDNRPMSGLIEGMAIAWPLVLGQRRSNLLLKAVQIFEFIQFADMPFLNGTFFHLYSRDQKKNVQKV